ncbi:hypothetical protein [Paraburkholderia heleia]|nr:hypothetical protein [Paraburkholderia heleia]
MNTRWHDSCLIYGAKKAETFITKKVHIADFLADELRNEGACKEASGVVG